MFDFGDELTIESYRIPWLISIQMLVLCLLVLLLFSFSFFPDDNIINNSSNSCSLTSAASTSSTILGKPRFDPHSLKTVTNRFQHHQARQNISVKGEIAASTGGGIVAEDSAEKELSSSEDEDYEINYHPCNYFRIAKLAFLKCFGLDFMSRNCSSSERRKDR
ncbi:hypothetical protein Tsubulata_018540 [Turnera subulata]|uniref:Transmembrane protein n=1 Tax=Turnera subulata TaxID=218843 RepID=A0A9Q0GG53_9ROSI|nr:hypothetical protein Tsubulata_018540 [Turnera subulata]